MRIDLSGGVFSHMDSDGFGRVVVLLHAIWRSAHELASHRRTASTFATEYSRCICVATGGQLLSEEVLVQVDARRPVGLHHWARTRQVPPCKTAIFFSERWPSLVNQFVLEDTPAPSGRQAVPILSGGRISIFTCVVLVCRSQVARQAWWCA